MMPIHLREFTIQSAVQAKPQTQTPDKSMLTLTNNLASSQQQQLSATKTNIFSSENNIIMQEDRSCEESGNVAENILSSSKNNIHNLINNSLVDMKNTLNIQGAGVVDSISLKRKSPINEEDLIKNDIKKPFPNNNRMNGKWKLFGIFLVFFNGLANWLGSYYKNSNLKENGGGGDSNGLGDEDDQDSDEDLEIIDSEMEQDHEENDDDEEDYSDDEYDEEDDDVPEEIDLEDEDEMNDENVESSSAEAINEKHLVRRFTRLYRIS